MPMVLKVPHLNVDFVSSCFPQYSLLGFGDILVPGGDNSYLINVMTERKPKSCGFFYNG